MGPNRERKLLSQPTYEMAYSNFDLAIGVLLKHEGGISNNPDDPGGLTKFGISLRFAKGELAADLDHDGFKDGDFNHDGQIDEDDIRSMSVVDAFRIYKRYWWDKFHYELITNQDVATKMLDCSVNMGASQAHKLAQRACNDCGVMPLIVDGLFGSHSIAALNSIDGQKWLAAMCKQQKLFYDTIIAKNPKLESFRAGWYKRANWPF